MAEKMSYPQGRYLWGMTGRAFWNPAAPPAPSKDEASRLIEACLLALREGGAKNQARAVNSVRWWFPDFKASELRWRKKKGGKRPPKTGKTPSTPPPSTPRPPAPTPPAPTPTPTPTPPAPTPPPGELFGDDLPYGPLHGGDDDATPDEDPTPTPEEAPAPEAEAPQKDDPDKVKVPPKPKRPKGYQTLEERIVERFAAGIGQIFMVGPSGCGKTTCGRLAALSMDLHPVVVSCHEGTPMYEFTGWTSPHDGHWEHTPFTRAYTGVDGPGLIILDEIDKLDAAVAAVLNAALANDEILGPDGKMMARHEASLIVATANTAGNGADRLYNGSNQLDGATRNRFAGGWMQVDYDEHYEKTGTVYNRNTGEHIAHDPEVVEYVWKARAHIKARDLRRIASTREIRACTLLKAAGLEWKSQVTFDWTDSEKQGLTA